MFFRDSNNKDKFTFACTLDATCAKKEGIRTYDKAFKHQKQHDAKQHPEHKRTN